MVLCTGSSLKLLGNEQQVNGDTTGTAIKQVGAGLSTAADLAATGANSGASGFNQSVLREQARQALRIGRAKSQLILSEGHRIAGEQQAATGSSGVQVGQGTALKVQQDTAVAAGADADQAYRDEVLQRWGYRAQANLERYQSHADTRSGYFAAASDFVGMFG